MGESYTVATYFGYDAWCNGHVLFKELERNGAIHNEINVLACFVTENDHTEMIDHFLESFLSS